MGKIAIIRTVNSFLIASLVDKLEELEHIVLQVEYDTDAINRIKEDVDGAIVYTDETVFTDMSVLAFIKDWVVTKNLSLFIIGGGEELEAVQEVIPKGIISAQYERPINLKRVSEDISEITQERILNKKKKILVVDDSGAMLWNVKAWLEERYQVILANSGAMAIKYLSLENPDLILLDYEMPIVDGRQVLEMIRAEVDFAGIPVFFLTAKSDKESVMKVMDLKPEGYLLKTMEPSKIVSTIDEFFIKQRDREIWGDLEK